MFFIKGYSDVDLFTEVSLHAHLKLRPSVPDWVAKSLVLRYGPVFSKNLIWSDDRSFFVYFFYPKNACLTVVEDCIQICLDDFYLALQDNIDFVRFFRDLQVKG